MPAQAGIHLRLRCKAKEKLDSLRWNDGKTTVSGLGGCLTK